MHCENKYNLQIHHIRYSGKYPWEALDDDLICLCGDCHKAVHSGEILDSHTDKIIEEFNSREEDTNRVICIKGNNFIGNYTLEEASEMYSIKKDNILKCCRGEFKTSKGYKWIHPKIGVSVEDSEIIKSPRSQIDKVCLLMNIPDKSILRKILHEKKFAARDLGFIKSILVQHRLTLAQKIILLQIAERLNKGVSEIVRTPPKEKLKFSL